LTFPSCPSASAFHFWSLRRFWEWDVGIVTCKDYADSTPVLPRPSAQPDPARPAQLGRQDLHRGPTGNHRLAPPEHLVRVRAVRPLGAGDGLDGPCSPL
jgi:hypothetical protein